MHIRRLIHALSIATILVIGTPLVQAAAPNSKIAARVLADTANGGSTEALVVLAEQADLRPAAALPTKLAKGRFVVNALRQAATQSQAPIRAFLDQRGVPYQSFYIVNMIKVTGDRALMQELAARSDVSRIDANPHVRTALPVPTGFDSKTDSVTTVEWNVQRVGAPRVWAHGFRGEGRVVASADTGVQWDHPALKSHYRGWNGTTVDHDYNWHDATSQHSPTPIDPYGHGTFTDSEMVGDDGAGNQVGVAPGAQWIACRNMDAGGNGAPSTYTECFEFLMAPYPVNGDPSQGDPSLAPDSINNSWTCPASEGCSVNTLLAVVNSVRAAGIFPSMAAGNSGPSCSSISDPPAVYDSSVTVGATNSANQISSFSSRGPVTADGSNRVKPDLSAPGENIRGAVPGNGYQSGWSGTSMAAPHVAGGVALLWQAKPALVGDVDTTEATFEATAHHQKTTSNCGGTAGKSPNNVFGYGIINLVQAVKAP
ncbi:MAG TPA: S8 family serine peptidase [Terriglobales bacterium]|nr:S8 family serine peptidase [Terriglobales bacterium]